MAGKYSSSDYMDAQALQVMGQLSGAIEGLIPQQGRRPIHPLQQNAIGAGGAPDLNCCAVVPTHCFRTVSQRSLSTPVKWNSDPITIIPGNNFLTSLLTGAGGAMFGAVLNGAGIVFNDANVQLQRQRVYELVLIAVRARVDITLMDATDIATQTDVNLGKLAKQLSRLASEYINLRIYHTADRNDPWVDDTPLTYFWRENHEFLPVAPVRWIDRDPAMELRLRGADFQAGVFTAVGGLPQQLSSRDVLAACTIVVESLFIPDPDVCGAYWPGELCPPDNIGNRPNFPGFAIPTAKKPGRD